MNSCLGGNLGLLLKTAPRENFQEQPFQVRWNGDQSLIQHKEKSNVDTTNALGELVFDNLYRLTSESISGGLNNGTIDYTYDKVSNRTSRNSSVAGVSNQSHTYTLNDLLSHHTYDANGSTIASPDLVNKTGKTADVYDFRNKLIRRTSDSGDVINLSYNADGHRVKKEVLAGGVLGTNRTINFLVDNNNPTGYSQVVEEVNGINVLEKVYHYGHSRIAMDDYATSERRRHFYSLDGHGSVRALTDADGGVKEEYDFDSYGILIGFRKHDGNSMVERSVDDLASLSVNTFLFAGEEWDADMGMYYNRARYLDVENGRFNAMDDWEGSRAISVTLNKYLYANGNGVSYIDPSGNFSIAGVMSANAIATNLRSISTKTIFSVGNIALNTIYGAYMGWSTKQIIANIVIGEVLGYLGGKAIAGVGSKLVSFGSNIPKLGTQLSGMRANGVLCFVEGTQVKTAKGFKNIEDIEVGDRVWSKSDTNTGEQGYKRVVKLFKSNPTELVHLTYRKKGTQSKDDDDEDSSTISGTHEHPFWSVDQQAWIPLGELNIGELLLLADGTSVIVEKREVEKSKEGETFTTFNFEVADWHTYYVAPEGETNINNVVWVHNTCTARGIVKDLVGEGFSKQQAVNIIKRQQQFLKNAYSAFGDSKVWTSMTRHRGSIIIQRADIELSPQNLLSMKEGRAPYVKNHLGEWEKVNLHHVGRKDGGLIEITRTQNSYNNATGGVLHIPGPGGPAQKDLAHSYWKQRYTELTGIEL